MRAAKKSDSSELTYKPCQWSRKVHSCSTEVQASSSFVRSWSPEVEERTFLLHSCTTRGPKVGLLGSLKERRGAQVEPFGPLVELLGSRVGLFAPLPEL